MTRAEEYRHLANKVRVRAAREESPILRAEWENLAESYVCLAEQTEASDQLDPLYDPIVGDLQVNIKRTIQ
jgi:hypothetical protein